MFTLKPLLSMKVTVIAQKGHHIRIPHQKLPKMENFGVTLR